MADNGTDQAKLYVILGSHPCRAAMLMLERKGIPYKKVTLPTGMQRLMPLRRFPHGTVPALVIDGRRVQTTIGIARALDELEPDPPLFPSDGAARRRVEEAERWADDVLQMFVRRTVLAASLHGPDGLINRGGDGPLGPLLWHNDRMRLIGARQLGRFVFNVNLETERALLAKLPATLDKIDSWIEAGTLDGDQLNAADYAIGASLALLSYRRDIQPALESRPAAKLATRVTAPA